MSGDINTGHDMWKDHKSHYGTITARIMCLRYLDMQSKRTDPEEREFCRELREAMDMEPCYRDKTYYRHSWETAQKNGEEEQFNDNDLANTWCAGEINDAIKACEYGDGSHKLKPAVQALIEHYGAERLSFVLALEVRRSEDSFSAENRDWSRTFDIQSGFAGSGIMTRSSVLDELITCVRETIEALQPDIAAEVPLINEAEQNFAAWLAVTESSRYKWVEDEIYRLNGRGAMYYTGGEDGIYMRISKDGKLEAGNYEGAIPHIGEAMFKPVVTKQFDSFNEAYKTAMEASGKWFLVDMFSGSAPQPLHKYCESHPEAMLDSGDTYKRYGFEMETDTRQYYTQCFLGESMRDARFIMYAYEKPAPMLEQARFGEVVPGTADESKMFYRRNEEGSLSIGYLRGDFGKSGSDFFHNWFDSEGGSGKKTPEFQAEFQTIMETLRQDVLKDLKSTQDYCYKHPEAQLPGDIHRYGFKVETESREYFIRCTVIHDDYFYVYAHDKAAPMKELEKPVSDKPSVLKQIRDAEKAPKTPRKSKAPDKKKDGAEL